MGHLAIHRAVIVLIIPVCCILGPFGVSRAPFGVWISVVAGLPGTLMQRNACPIVPTILGLVPGPVIARNFIMSMQIARGDLMGVFARPAASVIRRRPE